MPTSDPNQAATSARTRSQNSIKRKRKARLISFFIILIFVVFSAFFFHHLDQLYQTAQKTADKVYNSAKISKARDPQQLLREKKPISILLMGTDTGALGRNFKGRTDTMIVAILNPKKQKVTLVSLPRDALVAVYGFENYFPSKLNSAYDYGGSGTAVKTVQKYLNVPIDFYMTINMGGLENLVNAVDGVKIKSLLTFNYGGYAFKKGAVQTMNGKRALAYVRMRHSDPLGDYGRQQRQRQVLAAIAHKAGNLKNLMSTSFFDEISKQLQTDLTFKDFEMLALNYRHTSRNISSDHAQGEQDEIDGTSFESVHETEKQRVTNELRQALDLQAATTGSTLSSSNKINTTSKN
ncbi:LCP family protein [Liquorilactobacillus sicerae]|uniref:LCP family protein n=1 Tax=Liquorilactobacillus sicerae TaxID=1416943 RepID=UPI002481965D|nr:LCP family protein [Liquorilactobacillus sicerae]